MFEGQGRVGLHSMSTFDGVIYKEVDKKVSTVLKIFAFHGGCASQSPRVGVGTRTTWVLHDVTTAQGTRSP